MSDSALLDGLGEMNAYPIGPLEGPDGWYHLLWVWRDTPDCATNHDRPRSGPLPPPSALQVYKLSAIR